MIEEGHLPAKANATLELRVRTAKYFKSLPHREELLGGPELCRFVQFDFRETPATAENLEMKYHRDGARGGVRGARGPERGVARAGAVAEQRAAVLAAPVVVRLGRRPVRVARLAAEEKCHRLENLLHRSESL